MEGGQRSENQDSLKRRSGDSINADGRPGPGKSFTCVLSISVSCPSAMLFSPKSRELSQVALGTPSLLLQYFTDLSTFSD